MYIRQDGITYLKIGKNLRWIRHVEDIKKDRKKRAAAIQIIKDYVDLDIPIIITPKIYEKISAIQRNYNRGLLHSHECFMLIIDELLNATWKD